MKGVYKGLAAILLLLSFALPMSASSAPQHQVEGVYPSHVSDVVLAPVKQVKHSADQSLLALSEKPESVYVLLVFGLVCLLLEFFIPGMVIPGVLGVTAVLLSVWLMQKLSISYLGLGLLLLGFGLVIAELLMPFFAVLASAGIISFFIGSVFLFNGTSGGVGLVPWPVILSVTVVAGLCVFLMLSVALKARRRRVVSGVKGMLGQTGVIEDTGEWVKVMGERWRFESGSANMKPGSVVRVQAVNGLVLCVELVDEEKEEKVK